MKKRFGKLIAISATFLLSLSVSAQALPPVPKRVFVLNSFNRGYVWTDNMLRGMDETFAESIFPIETYVSFMDMKRIPPSREYFAQLKEFLKAAYGKLRFDAVLACDNDALGFLRLYRDELFPGLPLVFSSINDYDSAMLDGRNDITGTSENTDYRGTIELALKLLPNTRNLVVVVDETTTGKAHRSAMEKTRPQFKGKLDFSYLSFADYSLEGLATRLSLVPKDSVVLLLQHFMDKDGVTHTVQESTPVLCKASPVPVFVLTDIRLGLGAIGGHVVSGYHHGAASAEFVLRILAGTEVSAIPVLLDSPNRFMFDYAALKRFGIAESSLPEGSIILNRPISFLDQYRTYIVLVVIAFCILGIILVRLQFEVSRRIKMALALQKTSERLESLVETAMDGFLLSDIKGSILDVNASYCAMSGYSAEELRIMNVVDLEAKETPELVAAHRENVVKTGESRFESRHRRKDGSLFDVEVNVQYKDEDGGRFICFLHDITVRKAAVEELRKNLAEKEVLLREVHHRVKNNLNVISSLLNLQSTMIKSPEQAISAFLNSRNRIMAMALVQEELYLSQDYSHVDMDYYIKKLVSQLQLALGGDNARNVLVEADGVMLTVSASIPCGLIVNELLTNAFKYAYPQGQDGEIRVSLISDGETMLKLSVSDEGIGFPGAVDDEKRSSLGLTLINLLAAQLDGSVEKSSGPGTSISIRFPRDS